MEKDLKRPRRHGGGDGTTELLLQVFVGALDSLSDAERGLLLEEYGIEPAVSTPWAGPRPVAASFPDAQTRQAALSLARESLARAIESDLTDTVLLEISKRRMSPLQIVERELARTHELPGRPDVRDLRGMGGIRPDYDYKALRTESA